MRKFLLVVLLCFMFGVTYGFSDPQLPPPPSTGGPIGAIPPPGLPIDMGLPVLLIAGITLGIVFFKIKKSKSSL